MIVRPTHTPNTYRDPHTVPHGHPRQLSDRKPILGHGTAHVSQILCVKRPNGGLPGKKVPRVVVVQLVVLSCCHWPVRHRFESFTATDQCNINQCTVNRFENGSALTAHPCGRSMDRADDTSLSRTYQPRGTNTAPPGQPHDVTSSKIHL